MTAPKVSIIVTVFNEEDNIKPLIVNVQNALKDYHYELIFVDDGSSDQTVNKIRENITPNVKAVKLTKNFGQTAAMSAGIDQATGGYIVTMDGDLQNDPTDIPAMIEELENGEWDMVAGKRAKRKDGFFLRTFPSKIANSIIRSWTGVKVSDYGCSLKVMRSDIAKNLGLHGELHRFIPVLVQLQGGTITNMDVKHHSRIHGKSKYGLGRVLRVFSDLLLMVFFQRYAKRPMHLFGSIGLLTLLIGVGISIYLLIEKLMGQDIWGRPLLILGVTMVLVGIQFLTFGIIAEILMRTLNSASDRPIYRIKSVYVHSQD